MYQHLLQTYQLTEKLTLKNKVVMAPMTRSKSLEDNTPTEAMIEYYAKRADAGLIITEGTIIGRKATGYFKVPGLFQDSHIAGWKKVTDAVHGNGGKIFAQIWHVGRVSHPVFLDGDTPISASATTMTERVRRTEDLYYGTARAATKAEISSIIDEFKVAAINAIAAGFDGIEIHGANGYLLDQFLHYSTNLRTDEYGGSSENMARLPLEIINTIGEAIGYDKIGLRLSPGAYLNEIKGDPRDAAVFQYLLEQVNEVPIAYIHTGNFDDRVKFPELGNQTMTNFIRHYYQGAVIASGGYTLESAEAGLSENAFNLVAIGRPFIANPDLIEKMRNQTQLKEYDVNMLEMLI